MEKRLETKQMKLTKQTLKQIIKEELNSMLSEGRDMDDKELNSFRQNIADVAGNLKYYVENKQSPSTILYQLDFDRSPMYNIVAQLRGKRNNTFNYNKLESSLQTVFMPAVKEVGEYLTSGLDEKNKRLYKQEVQKSLNLIKQILEFSD
jgi:hypothetical protein